MLDRIGSRSLNGSGFLFVEREGFIRFRNLLVLIHEMYELGIDPETYGNHGGIAT
jgi:hypothetical protein